MIHRVLAIPSKRTEQTDIAFLTRPEIEALLQAPSQAIWNGRRDRTLLLIAVQTGLRVSELTGLRYQDVVLGAGAHVHCTGKGRKERSVPLWKTTAAAIRAWLRANPQSRGQAALLPNRRKLCIEPHNLERPQPAS